MRGKLERRASAADLRSLMDRIWPTSVETDGIVLIKPGKLPSTYRPVETYLVLPNLKRPAILLPQRFPARALATFAVAKSAGHRSLARAAGAALSHPACALMADSLSVGVRQDALQSPEAWSVIDVIADQLGRPGLAACLPVRRARPDSKPVMALIDPRGGALWAKVGWSPWTRPLVEREYRVLRELSGTLDHIATPTPVCSGTWRDLSYAVMEPIPHRTTRWSRAPECDSDILQRLAATGQVQEARLGDSRYLARLRTRLNQVTRSDPAVAASLWGMYAPLARSNTSIRFGRSHGDWVPWNLGTAQGRLYAWDWENSESDTPLGFDLLHWHFQTALSQPGGNLDRAVAALDRSTDSLSVLGVPLAARRLTASAYLLGTFARAARLAGEGAGWNSRLHRGLVRIARTRAHLLAH
jgi:hypothetical protein